MSTTGRQFYACPKLPETKSHASFSSVLVLALSRQY